MGEITSEEVEKVAGICVFFVFVFFCSVISGIDCKLRIRALGFRRWDLVGNLNVDGDWCLL